MITTVPLRQAGYRLAYTALRCYWFLVRPRVAGRLCLLVHEHQLLLIRNTYGSRAWTFPGGMIKRGETPEVSTQRKVREEVGIILERLSRVGQFTGRQAYRHDTMLCLCGADTHYHNPD
jgi:ADP-ribose pyrophosphatase YjhB (NUDIX family)